MNFTKINFDGISTNYVLAVENDKFIKWESKEPDLVINLHGRVVMPSFINSFDNLFATYLPFKGYHYPYLNWLSWDNELKSSLLFHERMLLNREDLYFLGAYKNIFSGVTFVVDHIPDFVFRDLIPQVDIDLLENFGIAHSPVSYALNWGRGIKKEYRYAIENNLPFIIRIGEGIDKESKTSIRKLEELEVLGRNTVLIHGVFLDDDDIEIIKKYDCSFVWCPEVNEFIYGRTAPVQKILDAGIRINLGSGSSMSGNKNFLSAIRTARKYISSSNLMMEFIFKNPVNSFFLNQVGKIEEKYNANFIVIDRISPKNYNFIFEINNEDILLVVRKGKPIMGSIIFENLFHQLNIKFEKIQMRKKMILIKKGFLNNMLQIYTKIGRRIDFPFFDGINLNFE